MFFWFNLLISTSLTDKLIILHLRGLFLWTQQDDSQAKCAVPNVTRGVLSARSVIKSARMEGWTPQWHT